MAVEWNYYDKFDELTEKYLPACGEGETKATQIMTCVSKLVYKWYNDGDVFDNTHYLEGWINDLSDYANWLYHYTNYEVKTVLEKINICYSDSDYEDLLKELTDLLLDGKYLEEQNKLEKVFSIYDCEGKFKFIDLEEEEEEEEEDEDYY